MNLDPSFGRPSFVAVACLAVELATRPCHAAPSAPDDRAQARQSYDHALALFDHGQNRAALAELERAYQLLPSFRIFYNIALVNVALDDPAAALRAFDRYLTDGGKLVDAERRSEVQRRVTALARRAGALRVDVDQVGALILVDDTEVGKSPLARPLWLNAGRHRLEVRADDGRSEERSFDLSAGDEAALRFDFKAVRVVSAPQRIDAPPLAAARAPLPWAAYGITAGFGAATIFSGVLALRARSAEQDVQHRITTEQELIDARRKVEHLALATDLFLAATAVGAGVSLYLTLKASEGPSGQAPQAALVIGPGQISAFARF